MLEFHCVNCGAGIAVHDEERRRPVVCMSCNTRQRVSDTAKPVPDMQVLKAASTRERAALPSRLPPQPPQYEAVTVIGYIFFVVAGVVAVVICIIAMLHPPESFLMLTGLLTPLGMVAGVLALFMLRDIAINTWHLRNKGSA